MKSRFFRIALVAFVSALSASAKADIHVIKVRSSATGADNGANWTDAFNGSTGVQKGLTEAANWLISHSNDTVQIWVAGGPYMPSVKTDSNDNRSKTFLMINKVELYGGFAGTETAINDRSLYCSGGANDGLPCEDSGDCPGGGSCPASRTILSGDLAGDDGTACTVDSDCGSAESCTSGSCSVGHGPCSVADDCIRCQAGFCSGNRADNAYHVVTYNAPGASVVLDGFVVSNGQANSNSRQRNQGSAIHIRKDAVCNGGSNNGNACSDPSDCPGGTCGAKCIASDFVITNCIFRNNYSVDHAAINDHGLGTEITHCVFRNNAAHEGAAIVVEHGSTNITSCLFEHNTAVAEGCHDFDAAASQGGAIWLGHSADSSCSGFASAPVVSGCVFLANVAEQGGAIWAQDTNLTVQSSLFVGNEAVADVASGEECRCSGENGGYTVEGQGGSIWAIRLPANESDVTITVSDCTFGDISDLDAAGDSATNFGGALFLEGRFAGKEITAIVEDSRFYGLQTTKSSLCLNLAGGGAIWGVLVDLTLNRNVFFKNDTKTGNDYGGGVRTFWGTTNADRNGFYWNHAYREGGAVWEENTTSTWTNCVFSGNYTGEDLVTTDAFAGAFYSAVTTLINCTFAQNHVDGSSVGSHAPVNVPNNKTLHAKNTIFWNEDDTAEFKANTSGQIVFDNCIVRGGILSISGGVNHVHDYIEEDPLFVDPIGDDLDAGTPDDELDVGPLSPAIDAGVTLEISGFAEDYDGDERIMDTLGIWDTGEEGSTCFVVDIGAQEHQANPAHCCYEGEPTQCCNEGSSAECGAGNVCCSHVCSAGNCCSDTQCTTIPWLHCRTQGTNQCVECTSSSHCGAGQHACCNNQCFSGSCCTNADCKLGKICCEDHVCRLDCGY